MHSVSLTVSTAGGSTAVAWSFGVQIYPDMAVNMTCVECHPTYPAMHPMTNCDSCHGYAGPIGGFYAPPDFHPDGEAAPLPHRLHLLPRLEHLSHRPQPHRPDRGPRLDDRHDRLCLPRANITIEHNRWTDDAGGALSCASCHGASASQRSRTRWRQAPPTASPATRFPPATPTARSTTPPTWRTPPTPPGSPAATATRWTSPPSTRSRARRPRPTPTSARRATPIPATSFDAWDDTCSQGGCHATGSPTAIHANEPAAHAYADPNASCLAVRLPRRQGRPDRDALERRDRPRLTAPSRAVWCATPRAFRPPRSARTATPTASQPHGYDAAMHTPTSATSLGCQVVGCHPCTDVGPLHANLPQGPCAVCHANSTKGDLTAGKTSANCEGCHITEKVDYHTDMDCGASGARQRLREVRTLPPSVG